MTRFPHQRLDAWKTSCEARRQTLLLLDDVPRAYADDIRQLRRAGQAVPKLIAEGANRWSPGAKRRRFEEAEGEIGEVASGLEDLADLGALDPQDVEPVMELWGRCRAMVLGLLKHCPR